MGMRVGVSRIPRVPDGSGFTRYTRGNKLLSVTRGSNKTDHQVDLLQNKANENVTPNNDQTQQSERIIFFYIFDITERIKTKTYEEVMY